VQGEQLAGVPPSPPPPLGGGARPLKYHALIVQIEADLRFCEDVLNNSSLPVTARDLQQPHRVGSAATAESLRHAAVQLSPPAQPADVQAQASAPCIQQQHAHELTAQLEASPQPPVQKGAAAKARNADELLALLASAPEGQPFEIDAALLYSPQSSCAPSRGHSSPSARSCSQDGLFASLHLGVGREGAQQHAPGPADTTQQQPQAQGFSEGARPTSGLRSSPGLSCPALASQHRPGSRARHTARQAGFDERLHFADASDEGAAAAQGEDKGPEACRRVATTVGFLTVRS
jgi:hypothetical protein